MHCVFTKCCSMSKVALILLISALLFCTITPDLIISTYVIKPWQHFYPQTVKGHRHDAITFKRAYLRPQIASFFPVLATEKQSCMDNYPKELYWSAEKCCRLKKEKLGLSFRRILVKIKSMRRGSWANTLGQTLVVVSAPLVTSSRQWKDI